MPGSAKAQAVLGGTVKRLLIAYFIGNIPAKKYQNPFTCVKSYSKPKGGTFFETQCTSRYQIISLLLKRRVESRTIQLRKRRQHSRALIVIY